MTKQGQISVKKGFWISKYEVSCRQSLGFCDSQRERFSTAPHLFSLKYACQYARRMQASIGGFAVVRLPTAAEWEVAAHYGNFQVTEQNVNEYAWIDEPGVPGKVLGDDSFLEWTLHECGGKKANPLGLYDMYGNVEEWTTGAIDQDIGMKNPEVQTCDICGKDMTVRGGSVRTAVSNTVKILTRDYFRGRGPCLDWKYYAKDQVERARKSRDNLPRQAGVRLVAEELPTTEEMNKQFGGRHWLCVRCGEFALDMNEPDKKGCKAGMHYEREHKDCKRGIHEWKWLADFGNDKYRCKYCRMELMVREYPWDVSSWICPGPADRPKQKGFMGRDERYRHKWEKAQE